MDTLGFYNGYIFTNSITRSLITIQSACINISLIRIYVDRLDYGTRQTSYFPPLVLIQ